MMTRKKIKERITGTTRFVYWHDGDILLNLLRHNEINENLAKNIIRAWQHGG